MFLTRQEQWPTCWASTQFDISEVRATSARLSSFSKGYMGCKNTVTGIMCEAYGGVLASSTHSAKGTCWIYNIIVARGQPVKKKKKKKAHDSGTKLWTWSVGHDQHIWAKCWVGEGVGRRGHDGETSTSTRQYMMVRPLQAHDVQW